MGLKSRWLLAALLVGSLAGCKKDESTSDPSRPAPISGAPASGPVETSPTPASAESVAPVISALGSEGMVPREVVLEFPRAVAPEGNEVKKGTVVTVSPNVPGALSFRSPSTLVFTPRESFAFNTQYTVTLDALELADGTVLKPKASGEWSRVFTTPAFSFVRLSPRQMDVRKGKVEADLVFSGPVDVAAVRRFASFSVDGKSLSDVKLRSHPTDRHIVTAALGGSSLKPGSEVRFTLTAGLSSAGRNPGTAAAGEDSFELLVG
jgi:hypothetical protein